jgi:putative transposase
MVEHPASYPWSSYRANAQNELSRVISPHCLYRGLGRTPESRVASYRELFRSHLEPGLVDEIRQATNGNYVMGSERFQLEVATAPGCRVTRGMPGRPGKAS